MYFDKVDFELETNNILENEKIILDFDVRYKTIDFNILIESIPVNWNIRVKDLSDFINETLLQKYNVSIDTDHKIYFYYNKKHV